MPMPTPADSDEPGAPPTRRAVLRVGLRAGLGLGVTVPVVGVAGACTRLVATDHAAADRIGSAAVGQTEGPADPDVVLLTRARATVAGLEALYRSAMRRQPALRRRLRPLLAVHQQHARVLGESVTGSSLSPSPTPSARRLPRDTDALLRRLADAEQHAAVQHRLVSREALSGAFARLAASIAAAEAQHVVVLRETADG